MFRLLTRQVNPDATTIEDTFNGPQITLSLAVGLLEDVGR